MDDVDYRMFAYAVDQEFSGDLSNGKQFCERLFHDDIVERKFESVTQYDRPVLDCVMHQMTNLHPKKRSDIVAILQDELPNLSKEIQSSPLNIEDGQDKFLREKPNRMRIFERVSHGASEEWRSISHFLLDYDVIQTICANHPNDVKVRLQKVLEKWHESTDPEKGTWLHLKSLLIFLKKQNLVFEIDEEVIKSTYNWNDNLFSMFRNNVISMESEKKNRYSATVTATVPNQWSIIYSFIECLKARNKFFNKKNILEKIMHEMITHSKFYEELGTVHNLVENIEIYKETGSHDSNLLKVLLNALANTFHLCIKILTKDEASSLYHLQDESHLIYPSRVRLSTDVIEMCLMNEDHIQPLQNVKVENFIKKDESIEIFQLKGNSCIFEAPSSSVQCCDTVILEEIMKNSDGRKENTRLIYELAKVERETSDDYDYIFIKNLDRNKSYRCLLEYQDEDGVKYKLTSKVFSLKNSSIGITLERYTPSHGCTVVAHRNVNEISDYENKSLNFQSHVRCFQSENDARNLSISDWTIQCQKYLECNLMKGNEKYFKDWIIFPNIFMNASQNVTKDVAGYIKEALSSEQIESRDPAGGVIIMNYSSQEHKKFLLKEQFEEEDQDFSNRIVVFHQKKGAILNIRVTESTRPKEISNEFSKCSKDAEDLDMVMQFSITQSKVTSPNITIATFVATPNLESIALKNALSKGKLLCDGCKPRVITKDQLSDVGEMKKWLKIKLPQILNNKPKVSASPVTMKHLIGQISGFIANTSMQVAKHSDDIHEQLIHLQANDEQIQVIVDPRKHKVIKAAFGCGKTIVGTLLSEFLARMANKPTTIYHISFDPYSLIDFNIDKHLMDLNLSNVESGLVKLCITNVSEIAAEMGVPVIPRVSQVLNYVQLQGKQTGRICHVCIDELNTSAMIPGEVQSVNLELGFMKESFVTLILQPFQYDRFDVSGEMETPVLVTSENELDMAFVSLIKNMRNSMKISELLEVAKDLINKEETRYFYPRNVILSIEENISDSSSPVRITDDNKEDHILSGNDDTEDIVNEGVTNTSKYLPVPIKPQESALKEMSEIDLERSTKGILIRYRFDRTGGVGHSHKGETPKLMYIPSTKCIKKFKPEDCDQEQSTILRLALCMEYINAGDTIICHDEDEFSLIRHALNVADKDFITYAHCLENRNKIPSKDEKKEVSEAISEKSKIVLTDNSGCRGFQLRKVVIPLSSTEQFRRHTILENAARATSDILFIVIDCSSLSRSGREKSTFRNIIERWISLKMVTVIKPKIDENSTTKYANRLPHVTLSQKTVSMIPHGKPTFDDLLDLLDENDLSSLQRILLSDPSIVTMRDRNGMTLLMDAARFNKQSIARMLVQHGSDIGNMDKRGWTALHRCAVSNSVDCLSFLLSYAPHSINHQDNDGQTALFLASRHGSLQCVKLLTHHDADPHIKNRYEETAYDVACSVEGSDEKRRRIQEVLLQHGLNHPRKIR